MSHCRPAAHCVIAPLPQLAHKPTANCDLARRTDSQILKNITSSSDLARRTDSRGCGLARGPSSQTQIQRPSALAADTAALGFHGERHNAMQKKQTQVVWQGRADSRTTQDNANAKTHTQGKHMRKWSGQKHKLTKKWSRAQSPQQNPTVHTYRRMCIFWFVQALRSGGHTHSPGSHPGPSRLYIKKTACTNAFSTTY